MTKEFSFEQFHEFDTVSTSSQFSCTFSIPAALDTFVLQSKCNELLDTWPILSGHLNVKRTQIEYYENQDRTGIFAVVDVSASHKQQLRALCEKSNDASHLRLITKYIDRTVNLGTTPRAQAFAIRIAVVDDISVVGFYAHHSLCDSRGLFHIASAYCDLLSGKSIVPLISRPSTILPAWLEYIGGSQAQDETKSDALLEIKEATKSGWGTVLWSICTDIIHRMLGPKMEEKTAHVSEARIESWRMESQRLGISVTSHDLLMAWLVEKILFKCGAAENDIFLSFTADTSRFLQPLQAFDTLQNTWQLVPFFHNNVGHLHQAELAAKIRQTIIQSREKEVIKRNLEHCRSNFGKPVIYRHYGSASPYLSVSSWCSIPFENLNFAGASNNRETECTYLSANSMFPQARSSPDIGLPLQNCLMVWQFGGGGYWFRGVLQQQAWERISADTDMLF